jgi:FkbM family methyltransferase
MHQHCRISLLQKKYSPFGIDHCNDIARFHGEDSVKIIIDVGANIGNTVIEYAKCFPYAEIIAIEPIKTTYDILSSNISELSKVKTFQCAVGSEAGTVSVNIKDHSECNSLIDNSSGDAARESKEMVEVKRLDDLASSEGLLRFDILKTDTEGYALEVLKGATQLLSNSSNAFILSEVTFHRKDPCHTQFIELHQYLSGFGFDFCGIYDQDYNSFAPAKPPLLYCNALFYKR